jgi:flagellar basal body P-ring formation protein FlgA
MKMTICLPLLALLYVSPVQAQQFEDLSVLDAKVASAVGVGSVKPIDRRLKLARCPEPVTLDTAAPSTVVLRCNIVGWRIRVPVAQAVGASNAGEILVKRGETVEMVIQGDGFEIASSGIAIEDGFSGKRIRVKSSTGNGSITGTVVGQALVSIQD